MALLIQEALSRRRNGDFKRAMKVNMRRNSSKNTNIRIIMIPEEERENNPEGLFKDIIAENTLSLGKTRTYKSTKLTDHPIISM